MSVPRHVVFATHGSLGDLYPFLAVGRALSARGHRVTVATSLSHRASVEQAGLAFRAMRPEPDGDAAFHARFMHPRTGPQFVFQHHLAPAIMDSHADLCDAVADADLLVSQSLALAAPLVAATTRIPWVSAVFQPMTLFSAWDPPSLPFLPFRRVTSHQATGAYRWNRQLLDYARHFTRSWIAPVDLFKHELGLPDDRHPVYEGQHAPRLTLAMFSPLLGTPQPDWPASCVQTGTAFYPPCDSVCHTTTPSHSADDASLPADLQAFLRAGPAPVIVTLGGSSANAAGDFYVWAAQAVRALGQRAVLLASGLAARDPRLQSLPKDVCVAHHVPYGQIFPLGCAIVHAGGIGTAMLALRAGKPQLIVPSAHDQHDNAKRVARLGVADVLPMAQASSRRLRHRLSAVLANDRMQQRARDLAPRAGQEDGAAVACACLEEVLGDV